MNAKFDREFVTTKNLSLAEYASELTKTGQKSVHGEQGTLWVRSETFGMIRFPTFHLTPPTLHEVSRVLWKGPAAAITFVIEPDEHHPPNTLLYICQDQSYNVEKLSKPARRDVRRALRNLVIAPVEWPVLLEQGFPAFSDTIARIGLSKEIPSSFRGYYENFSRNPCHHVIGAWKEHSLVAFMTLWVLDDWVEIEGSFFRDAYRGLCPSNGIAHYVLDHFLVQRKFRTVSYGMSSVQSGDKNTGLHAYKTKAGFEARPAHRAYVLHPFLQPFANRVTLSAISAALRFMPGDRRLKKAAGVFTKLISTE